MVSRPVAAAVKRWFGAAFKLRMAENDIGMNQDTLASLPDVPCYPYLALSNSNL